MRARLKLGVVVVLVAFHAHPPGADSAAAGQASGARLPCSGPYMDAVPPLVQMLRDNRMAGRTEEMIGLATAYRDSIRATGDTLGPEYALSLECLMDYRLVLRRWGEPKTREYAWEVLRAKQRAFPECHPDLAWTEINTAVVESRGFRNFERSDSLLHVALERRRRIYGNDHALTAYVRVHLAENLGVQGDFLGQLAQAESCAASARTVASRDSSKLAFAFGTLAGALSNLGWTEEALAARQEQLQFVIANRSASPLMRALIRLDLAIAYADFGRYAEAQAEILAALSLDPALLDPTNDVVRSAYATLGWCQFNLGDHVQARASYERATHLPAGVKAEPLDAWNLAERARVELVTGEVRRASAMIEESVAMAEGWEGPAGSTSLFAREVRAHVRAAEERSEDALADLDHVRLTLQAQGVDERSDHIQRLRILAAGIHAAAGDTAGAVALLDSVRSFAGDDSSAGSLARSAAELALARLALAKGDLERARALALEVERASWTSLAPAIRLLPERQALRHAALRPAGLPIVLASLRSGDAATAEAVRAAFDAVVRSRGLVLDELAAHRREQLDDARAIDAEAWQRLERARKRWREFQFQPPVDLADAARAEVARTLQQELTVAEAELLARRPAASRTGRAAHGAGLDEIQRGLPAGSALVSFIRADEPQALYGGPHVSRHRRTGEYVAFVLSTAGRPSVHWLGDADSTDLLARGWLEAAGPGSMQMDGEARIGEALRSRVWDSLASDLAGAQRVYVVADGALAQVQLDALPGAHGRFLVEEEPAILRVACERDLVATEKPNRARPATALLVGGVDYDRRENVVATVGESFGGALLMAVADRGAADAAPTYRGLSPACLSMSDHRFEPLPASRLEVEEARTQGSTAAILQGPFATEARVKMLAPQVSALHVATHGFFLDPGCLGGETAALQIRNAATTEDRLMLDNPLTRCGLALAGANRRAEAGPDEDDGLLTGDEIAALDLSGVEFVVLSACNTGVGEVLDGEGVLGLQRAFKIAGAGPVVMSLWPVEDQVARQWMRHFYEARLSEGVTTAEATRRASLAMLAERRRLGLSTRPSSWAPFVSVGVER